MTTDHMLSGLLFQVQFERQIPCPHVPPKGGCSDTGLDLEYGFFRNMN